MKFFVKNEIYKNPHDISKNRTLVFNIGQNLKIKEVWKFC